MNHELPPEHEYVNLTRRDALVRALTGGIAAAAMPLGDAAAAQSDSPKVEEEFVPENDYPFFGAEPPWVKPDMSRSQPKKPA
jgi:hypothetical protein